MASRTALPFGALVTSDELPGSGTWVLHSYCLEGDFRRAVLVPVRVYAALANAEPPPDARVLVAPSTVRPAAWPVAALGGGAPGRST